MRRREFIARVEFAAGDYDVVVPRAGEALRLLSFRLPSADESYARHPPERVEFVGPQGTHDHRLATSALVRAGARHPGLRDEALSELHRTARAHRHIELFTDLNALTTGLVQHVTRSLGAHVARIVVASVAVDVLHEYQSSIRNKTSKQFRRRDEMRRALGVLTELREHFPVHVHQLPPGAARWAKRGDDVPDEDEEETEEARTYISEDRQMIAAYWDYLRQSNPRVPVFLITSDFALGHVCTAERVNYLFARSPYEHWRRASADPVQAVWCDPFSLQFRWCLPHDILWEVCLVYGEVLVKPVKDGPRLRLEYERRDHLPGSEPSIQLAEGETTLRSLDEAAMPTGSGETGSDAAAAVARPPKKQRASPVAVRKVQRDVAPDVTRTHPKLALALAPVFEVLPVDERASVALKRFAPTGKDALRHLRQIGELTGLYVVDDERVSAGPRLAELLSALRSRDFTAINEIFRRHPTYDELLNSTASGGPFPNNRDGGAVTGWSVVLGAAYKSADGVRFGLAAIDEATFATLVDRVHAEAGGGQPAVPLPPIVDRVCRDARISPVRFEALLDAALGPGGLLDRFEAQRSGEPSAIPSHPVIADPVSTGGSWTRPMDPGRGLIVGETLVNSLVRRPGGSA